MAREDFGPARETGDPHHLLFQLAGRWRGTTRTWFQPEVLADESIWEGTIRPVLGGRFAIHEYCGTLQDKPLEGLVLIGYDRDKRRYQTAWIDTFHTGTAILTGLAGEPPRDQRAETRSSYRDPEGGPDWGWITRFEREGPDQLRIVQFNVTPDGQEAKALETDYRRIEEA